MNNTTNYKRDNHLKKFTIYSFIVTCIIGVLLHFAYNFFGNNIIVGLFTPINESTWEHLKLLYFPMLLCMLVGLFNYKDISKNLKLFVNSFAISIFTGMLLIVVLFYTISGIIGKNVDWINIAIYFIAVIWAYALFFLLQTKWSHCRFINSETLFKLSVTALIICTLLFFLFTILPPKIGLFKPPLQS